ncbi:hypothetical protein [Streptomyces sp. NPDC046197]|uniref:hypothetical protein n=1 Tax=Streptomyces sp. NPDC046197 TaxID=3154337 RepID=UPI0033F57224
MIIIACLLPPMTAFVLYGMDRVEDWQTRAPQPPHRARHRHLRLIQGGGQESVRRPQADQERSDAA